MPSTKWDKKIKKIIKIASVQWHKFVLKCVSGTRVCVGGCCEVVMAIIYIGGWFSFTGCTINVARSSKYICMKLICTEHHQTSLDQFQHVCARISLCNIQYNVHTTPPAHEWQQCSILSFTLRYKRFLNGFKKWLSYIILYFRLLYI